MFTKSWLFSIVPDIVNKYGPGPEKSCLEFIDIAVNNEFVDITVDTIIHAASHGVGEIGDGKIFITPLEECIRIRTRERGGKAI